MTYALIVAALIVELAAAVITLVALWESVEDVGIVRREGIGNGRRLYAFGSLRRETVRLATLSVFIGLTWMVLARLDPTQEPSTRTMLIFGLFLSGQVFTAANSLLDMRLWRRLRTHNDR